MPILSTEKVQRNNRRLKLLQISCEMFLKHGYTRTSLDAIIACSGGSKSTLYRYFKNKRILFVTCIEYFCEEFVKKLQSIDVDTVSLKERLHALLHALTLLIVDPKHIDFYRLVIAESAHFPEVGATWYESGARLSRQTILVVLQSLVGMHETSKQAEIEHLATILFDTLLSYLTTHVMILGESVSNLPMDALINDLIDVAHQRLSLS